MGGKEREVTGVLPRRLQTRQQGGVSHAEQQGAAGEDLREDMLSPGWTGWSRSQEELRGGLPSQLQNGSCRFMAPAVLMQQHSTMRQAELNDTTAGLPSGRLRIAQAVACVSAPD